MKPRSQARRPVLSPIRDRGTRRRLERLEPRLLLSSEALYALNVGGPAVTDAQGLVWVSDAAPVAGVTTNFAQAFALDADATTDAANTSDPSVSLTGRADNLIDQSALTNDPADYTAPDAVFQSWRVDHNGGENLSYRFAVDPGKYRVDLYFVEPSKTAPGKRVFDVQIDGATVLDDFDIYAEAGVGAALGRSFVVNAASQLEVAFVNEASLSAVSAIRVSRAASDVDLSFNPTTFTAVGIGQIRRGDVVELQPGIYRLSDADLHALLDNTNNERVDITLRGVPGQTILDFTHQSETEHIRFDRWVNGYSGHYTGVTLDGLTFLNAAVGFNRGNGGVVRNSVFDGYEGKVFPSGDRALHYWSSDNVVIENNYFHWNNTSKNITALAYGQGSGGYVGGNRIEGLLRSGIKFWKQTNGVVELNDLARWTQTPGAGDGVFEDHGIYNHDSSGTVIRGNTVRGWSDTSAGGSLKIKNVDHIEVTANEFYTSGILGRVESMVEPHLFEHIWIHGNNIYDAASTAISIWTPGQSPIAVRVEDNLLHGGGLNSVRDVDPALYNQTVQLAGGLPGGVYNNNAGAISLAAGINQSGNTTSAAAASAAADVWAPAVAGADGVQVGVFDDSAESTPHRDTDRDPRRTILLLAEKPRRRIGLANEAVEEPTESQGVSPRETGSQVEPALDAVFAELNAETPTVDLP
ncbi:MAG: malectin domain-containing carbohydrate-binding protein [Planctomycetota bacterium]